MVRRGSSSAEIWRDVARLGVAWCGDTMRRREAFRCDWILRIDFEHSSGGLSWCEVRVISCDTRDAIMSDAGSSSDLSKTSQLCG